MLPDPALIPALHPAPTPAQRLRRSARAVGAALLVLLLAGAAAWTLHELQSGRSARTALAALEPGPIDTGFAQSMSLHHQQAIGMAQMMLDGRPTPLAALARSIAYAQLVELGEMRGWLRLWQRPLLPATRSMDWMLLGDAPPDAELLQYLLDCQRSPTGMSGLATDAELQRLRQLDGRERDALFLQLMLEHHRGGLPMAQFAAANAQLAVVRALAGRIVVDQAQEILRIRQTQYAMGAAAADPGAAPEASPGQSGD